MNTIMIVKLNYHVSKFMFAAELRTMAKVYPMNFETKLYYTIGCNILFGAVEYGT